MGVHEPAHSQPLDRVEMSAGQETSPERACAERVLKCWTSNNSDESSDNVPVNQRHGSSGDKCTSFEESYESLMFHKENEKNNALKCMLLKMQVQLCGSFQYEMGVYRLPSPFI